MLPVPTSLSSSILIAVRLFHYSSDNSKNHKMIVTDARRGCRTCRKRHEEVTTSRGQMCPKTDDLS